LFSDSFSEVISSNKVDKTFSTSALEVIFLTFQLIFAKVVLNLDFHS
jgi:hypothetical protein